MTYEQWATRHPLAAADLLSVLGAIQPVGDTPGLSEQWAQQHVRLAVAKAGGMAWRNNVGATPAKCPHCGTPQQPVRYGLANDSAQLNARVKSSDLILAIPRVIRPQDVGRTIAQFGAVETKRPGWVFKGTDREVAQAAWLSIVKSLGGFAAFSTGEVDLCDA